MVFGGYQWFLVVLVCSRRFLVVLGGSWQVLMVFGGSWHFSVVLGHYWWFLVVLGGSWALLIIIKVCDKGARLIILDFDKYIKACHEHLESETPDG